MNPENRNELFRSSWTLETVESENGSSDLDYGYAKSESSSYQGTNAATGYSESTASTSSGFTSRSSSGKQSVADLCDVVNKISISQKKDEHIFKPEFRLSLNDHGPPRFWANKNLQDIDFLEEHTKYDCQIVEPISEMFNQTMTIRSKLDVHITLKKCESIIINIQLGNTSLNNLIEIHHLLWINLYDHQIMTMNCFTEPIQLQKYEEKTISIAANHLELGKDYKMVIYYGPPHFLFSKEFTFKLTTRPISTMRMEKLEHFFPTAIVRKLDRYRYRMPGDDEFSDEMNDLNLFIRMYEKSDPATRLTSANYYSIRKLLLQMEDETESKRSLYHDQVYQLVKYEFGRRYSLPIYNERLEKALNEYTRLWITPMSIRDYQIELQNSDEQQTSESRKRLRSVKKQRIYGSIVEIQGSTMYFELEESLDRFTAKTNIQPDVEAYFIRFMSDRTTITLEHRALEYLYEHNVARFFFPTEFPDSDVFRCNNTHPSTYSNRTINWNSDDINDEQKTAVINILKQTSYPYPYLLFGPPGTGKTKTLTEAILQIIQNNKSNEHILVCATSNAACNEIATRLLANIGPNQLFRIFSKSVARNMSNIPNDVLQTSNLQTGEHYYPSLQVIYQHKVIVCTLTTAGRLSQGRIAPKHFSHIFIDEAGSATESQTLIAVAGLCTTQNRIHANLIFAGDPKQLGPLIKSKQAIKMGHGVSMLERLITTNSLYMKNKNTKQFNQNYVTQLIRNYRSHASILHSSNELYYDNTLKVCAPTVNTDWFIGSNLLKDSQFPVIFHSVKGITDRDSTSHSSYNLMEVDKTIAYLRQLFTFSNRQIMQTDIGIISPYRRQCEELVEMCELSGYYDIQIGSVEVFQGQEKPIIIVSTVRSQMDNIGFLNNKKRLNVLLTRAKCLLIIIGDADTLAMDKDWKYVIEYCKTNNSLVEEM